MSRGRAMKKILLSAFIPILLLMSLASWGLASPVGSSPDDNYHMASIWCGQGVRDGLCELGEAPGQRKVSQYLNESANCYAFQPSVSAACAAGIPDVLVNTDRGNFSGVYPPVYYGFMSIFAGEDIATAIIAMRIANAFLFVGVGSLLFFLIPRARRTPLVWGGLGSLVPLGMFLVPSVNPSSWAILSAATLWVALLGYFEATSTAKRVSLAGVVVISLVMGAGARSDAAVYGLLAMFVAVVLSWKRTKRFALLCLLPAALVVAAIVLFMASGQSSIVTPDAITEGATRAEVISLTFSNLLLLPQLWAGALGLWGLGWLDTAMPGLVWVSTLAVFVGMVFWGLNTMGKRKGLALSMIFGSLIIIPMYILVNDRVLVGSGVQPRYILPLMVILIGVALFQAKPAAVRLSPVQLLTMASMLSVANTVALHINIQRYVTGIEDVGVNLNRDIQWWWELPFSPMAVWIVGSVAFGATLFGAAYYTIRESHALAQDLGGAAAIDRRAATERVSS